MSELPSTSTRSVSREQRHSAESPAGQPLGTDPPAHIRRMVVWPAISVALIATALVTFLLLRPEDTPSTATAAALIVAAAGCAVIMLLATGRAAHTEQSTARHIDTLRTSAAAARRELQGLIDQLQQGERPMPRRAELPPANDDFGMLAHDLDRLRQVTAEAVVDATVLVPGDNIDKRVGVFLNLARRLQSLVHREIQLLDDLEAQVEDPDLLKGLFAVDHLATRIRRHAENLAVLGGAVSRRQWSRPVNVYEILRSAVAEVEHYSRVKLVRPIEGHLRGHAVADVIHLVAELVENATKFSAPNTQVLVRAELVTSGLAVEVEDRGLGMRRDEQHRINGMLASPDRIDVDELLQDGRIGLFVVAALARRHDIAVQLQTNIYGGTQAILVLPHTILGTTSEDAERVREQPQIAESTPRQTAALPSRSTAAIPASAASSGTPTATFPAATGANPLPLPVAGNGVKSTVAPDITPTMDDTPTGQQPVVPRSAPPSPKPSARSDDPVSDFPAGTRAPASDRPSPDPRPQLPRRRKQAHLAPQLREAPTAAGQTSSEGHDPGLMMAFQRGIDRADATPDGEGTPPDRPSEDT